MRPGEGYEVTLKRKRGRYLPKKILRHTKLNVTEHYSFNVSVWVADTPESNFKPTVNLVLHHNGDKIRFCFPDAVTMCLVMKELTHFLDEIFVVTHERHTDAVTEYLEFHRKQLLPYLNDNTVYTVIQDRAGETNDARVLRVDKRTGEIIEAVESTERFSRGPDN